MFKDLLRRFNEKTNAAAGWHFIPREIIELMTHLGYLPVKCKIIRPCNFLIYKEFVKQKPIRLRSVTTKRLQTEEIQTRW